MDTLGHGLSPVCVVEELLQIYHPKRIADTHELVDHLSQLERHVHWLVRILETVDADGRAGWGYVSWVQ